MALRSELLPEPTSPMTHTNSPCLMFKLTSLRAKAPSMVVLAASTGLISGFSNFALSIPSTIELLADPRSFFPPLPGLSYNLGSRVSFTPQKKFPC
jgi:hypothetical protein